MVFATISLLLVVIWRLTSKGRKFPSVSFAMLAGTLLFVGLGLELDRYENLTLSVVIMVAFYVALVMGAHFARRLRFNGQGMHNLGEFLSRSFIFRYTVLTFFAIYALLPSFGVLISGQSFGQILRATWASDTQAATSQMLVETSLQSLSGINAFVNAVQVQLSGFWYLALGLALMIRSRLVFPVLAVYIFGTFLSGSSSRTIPMMALLLPFMIWALSARRPRFRGIVVLGMVGLALLLGMDYLVKGRQGEEAQGGIAQRVERTLRTDFAYGGLGLKLGMDAQPGSLERGIEYLVRIAVLPIPRVLWPSKPSTNPNQIFTEWYTERSLEEVRTIILFTPLGEALFFFGYLGIALVPFLYGFTAILFERIYSTSEVYKGLLIQVYLWAFISMRLTYFNLFEFLVVQNFVLITILVAGQHFMRNKYRRLPSGESIA